MLQCTAELPSLTQLSALSSLSVVGVSAAGLRSIAGLTGLSDLKLQSTEWARISWEGLLPVTAPRQLTRLMRSPYDEGVSTDADEEEGREANVYLVDLVGVNVTGGYYLLQLSLPVPLFVTNSPTHGLVAPCLCGCSCHAPCVAAANMPPTYT